MHEWFDTEGRLLNKGLYNKGHQIMFEAYKKGAIDMRLTTLGNGKMKKNFYYPNGNMEQEFYYEGVDLQIKSALLVKLRF